MTPEVRLRKSRDARERHAAGTWINQTAHFREVKRSPEHRASLSRSKVGERNPMYLPVGTTRLHRARKGQLIYVIVKFADVAGAGRANWKPEHRHIMECVLGRALAADEVIHHVDGNTLNNDPANLVLMTKYEHQGLHNHARL